MPRSRISLLLLVLAVLPFALAACGKGGGGY
jgi:predicted small lipoprotein YifL